MRIIFILLGVQLITRFTFVIYIFGIILLWAAYKMIWGKEADEEKDINTHPALLWMRRHFPVAEHSNSKHFFTKQNGKWLVTPLLLTLIIIEISDLVFAVDSIPAVIAVSRDPFIVITSNIFAILGLRALFFVVHGLVEKFVYLKQ